MVESDANVDKVGEDGENSKNGFSELDGKIIRQVEYYFGDFNLLKDKFLQEQIKEDDGWVPLTILLKFNRLASLSKDPKVIVDALEKSSSGLIEISEGKDKIRRSPHVPIPEMNEDRRKELMERTVYCKGLPRDSKLNDLLEFFYKFGDIENVTMRSWHDKATKVWNFKGSVFVIFKSVEGADKFLKLESVKYNDSDEELIRKWQKDYIEEKRKERLEVRMKHSKKSKGQENKKSKVDSEGKSEEKEGSDAEDEGEDEEKEDSDGFATGTVVALAGLDSSIKWDNIKERIEEMGLPVAFIEYTLGDEVAFVRLANKDTASELAKLVAKEDNDNKIKIGDKELSLRVVEGEEEKTFLEKQKAELMKKRIAAQRRKGMNKKGRGKKNRGKWDNRKRRGTSPSGEPPSKVKAN
ncbi:hypothetical protein O3M35_005809 [Rhynocoris fuscipes]|uniref:LA protein n=1 Tax=Rhynocoris fuscipes TaxID=488301 RepID=A0AAW1DJJ1_9HEMI